MPYTTRGRSGGNDYIDRMAARYISLFGNVDDTDDTYRGTSVAEEDVLTVDLVDFYAQGNSAEHHTENYELISEKNTPVLRRGQSFYMLLRFKERAYDADKDKVKVVFSFGARPDVAKGTKAIVTVKQEKQNDEKKWQASVDRNDGSDLMLRVNIPVKAPVGSWECSVTTSLVQPADSETPAPVKDYHCSGTRDIYILFNPWNKDDTVYMENDVWRKEYVENDQGKVWQTRYSRGTPWIFGQYTDVVLPACCFILEKSGLKPTERSNPVKVVRALSAIINSCDNNGVLEGNWSGDYSGGTEPWVWTGSAKILEQYLLSRGTPVKYGQCWVFSTVFTTVCRAIGIPCRTVSNFSSAHDTDASLTIDKYFDKEGQPMDKSSDSIWNFHVWNDAWMARPDLKEGYGGWQAVDATPQEQSSGLFQCGPASVEAIKRGEVNLPYDVPFVYSEVNADVFSWMEDPESDTGYKLIKKRIDRLSVGKALLTKQAELDDDDGDGDREDVMDQYKNPEGTEAIKWAVLNAVGAMDRASEYYDIPTDGEEDVEFTLHDIDAINVGDPFQVKVTIKNNAEVKRSIKVQLSAYSVYYNGVKAMQLTKAGGNFTVGPSDSQTIFIRLTADQYWSKLVPYGLIKIYAMANVRETKQVWGDDDDFVMTRPNLTIDTVPSVAVGEKFEAKFYFTNPLQMPLTECKISLEASDIQKPRILKYAMEVKPGGLVEYVAKFTAKKQGQRKVIAKFSSRELINVTGSKTINVQ